jgi:antitoxin VapB
MTLNIKDTETEKLAAEIAEMTGDTKTGAVRQALRERKKRLETQAKRASKGRPQSMQKWLEEEVWPLIPEEERGQPPMSKEEIEEILGFGEGGV